MHSARVAATHVSVLVEVADVVEPGDVLAIDTEGPEGRIRLARKVADIAVFGIVSAEAGVILGEGSPGEDAGAGGDFWVPVAVAGLALAKVDASYGVIRPGDLLVSSATPGHAMKAPDVVVVGTVIGKALEPLESGTGLIKMLVMPR